MPFFTFTFLSLLIQFSSPVALLRNADPKLKDISLSLKDRAALTAFLNALNEDYE